MDPAIVIEGQGSAHPKLGVAKKKSVDENLKILQQMIESGKLSLDHAINKTRPGGTLRGVFNTNADPDMLAHVEELYAFVVAWKQRLVPGYDPAAPVPKVAKPFEPNPPVVEAAKSGRATCKYSGELIDKGEMRCGLPTYARGNLVTAWFHAKYFPKALRFEATPDNRTKCKASGAKIPKDAVRLCARIGSAAELESGEGLKAKLYYLPSAVAPFFKDLLVMARVAPFAIEGYELLSDSARAALAAPAAKPAESADVEITGSKTAEERDAELRKDAVDVAMDDAAPAEVKPEVEPKVEPKTEPTIELECTPKRGGTSAPAPETAAALASLAEDVKPKVEPAAPKTAMDPALVQALRDAKALCDDGVLTMDEYQAKKQELLKPAA